MWKKCKVVIIATYKESRLFLKTGNQLEYNEHHPIYGINHYGWKYQNLYILSDDEIKENDWYYYTKSKVHKHLGHLPLDKTKHDGDKVFKIIAITDSSLNLYCNHCGAIKELATGICVRCGRFSTNSISSISQSFIKQYVSEYNKGNKIEEVMVEYEEFLNTNPIWSPEKDYKEYSTIREKLNPDNTISIKATKTSWTKEEVSDIIRDYRNRILALISMKYEVTNNFTEEFINNNL